MGPDEPLGKPKNTRVGSLSLLQWIFPTQESNQGLLHCTRILYQLSHKGSPRTLECVVNLLVTVLQLHKEVVGIKGMTLVYSMGKVK